MEISSKTKRKKILQLISFLKAQSREENDPEKLERLKKEINHYNGVLGI